MAAASGAALLNCSADSTEEEESGLSEDDVTGVNNTLGLSLVYDADTSKVKATLAKPLGPTDKLFIRVRRGTIKHDSQKDLDCSDLPEAPKTGAKVAGKVVYEGPSVSKELVNLLAIYNDERWYGGHETPEMLAEIAKGPDSIVEACVVRSGKVRAKLLTNLAYAWDRGEDLKKAAGGSLGTRSGIHLMAGDAGLESEGGVTDGDGGAAEADGGDGGDAGPTGPVVIPEGPAYNTIDYANLCVQELGEIPFFKKLADGKYESFDCRDFVGSHGDEPGGAVEGVEGAVIPLHVDGAEQTKCSEGRSSERSYDCVDKCDRGMYLTASSHTGLGRKAACQPGVTVTTARNAQGSSWVLLCRKVEDTGPGMMQTKRFNDIAIIGNDPKTGKTCFFQNKENIGNDGSKVVHPADVARSSAIWPSTPSSYCTKNCHAADAFVHSPWIDQALRSNGKPIVPKMGEHPDYQISNLEAPYRLINGPAQGFSVPKQLVSEPVAPCTTCHRVAGAAFAEFAEWSTGKGDAYFQKITDSHKAFPNNFWMPPRLDNITQENFDATSYGKAVAHIRKCMDNNSDPECEFADIPTGR